MLMRAGGGERGQLLQPQDDPPPFSGGGSSPAGAVAADGEPVAAAWNFKSSGIAHALARASSATKESASALDGGGAGAMRMLPPGQSRSFAWAAVQGRGRAVRLADGQPVRDLTYTGSGGGVALFVAADAALVQ